MGETVKFHLKAILGTAGFIFFYMFGAMLINPNPVLSYRWIKDIEISFSSITSIGALFWSLYALYRFQNMANFENLIQKTIKDIMRFGKSMKKFNKLLKIPGLMNMVTGMIGEDDEINNNQNFKEVEDKYIKSNNLDLKNNKK